MKYLLFSIIASITLFSCTEPTPKVSSGKLPILGNRDVVDGDTVYHTVPDFSFINQDSQAVTNATFKDKLYVVDFFFTSCPTICPKVKKQMLQV